MLVIGDEVFGIGCKSTINKLVVVWVFCYQPQTEMRVNERNIPSVQNKQYDILSDARCGLLLDYLLSSCSVKPVIAI